MNSDTQGPQRSEAAFTSSDANDASPPNRAFSSEPPTVSPPHNGSCFRGGCCGWFSRACFNIRFFKRSLHKKIESLFEKYAGFIFDYPLWFIVCATVASLILGLGLLRRREVPDGIAQYSYPGSKTRLEVDAYESLFEETKSRQIMILVKGVDGKNLMNKDFLNKFWEIHENILKIKVKKTSKNYLNEAAVEMKILEGEKSSKNAFKQALAECNPSTASPIDRLTGLACLPAISNDELDFAKLCKKWNESCIPPSGILFMYADRSQFGDPIAYPKQPDPLTGLAINVDLFIGGTHKVFNAEKTEILEASALQIVYKLEIPKALQSHTQDWEAKVRDYILENQSTALPGAEMFIFTETAIGDELAAATGISSERDIIIVVTTVSLVALYVALSTFSYTYKESKAFAALMGGVASIFAALGGLGFGYLIGLESTSTMLATPFLLLGIGMDDVFVILNAYKLEFADKTPKDRIKAAIKYSGTSITITTVTNIISFFVGALNPFLAIRNFCICTAFGLFWGYLAVLTFFLGWLCIDAKKEMPSGFLSSRIWTSNERILKSARSPIALIEPVLTHTPAQTKKPSLKNAFFAFEVEACDYTEKEADCKKDDNMGMVVGMQPISFVLPEAAPPLRNPPPSDSLPLKPIISSNEAAAAILHRGALHCFFNFFYEKIISQPIGKLSILLLFLVYVGLAIYGCSNVEISLELSMLAKDGSYATKFLNVKAEEFPGIGDEVNIFFSKKLDWCSKEIQESRKALSDELRDANYTLYLVDGFEVFERTTGYDLSSGGDDCLLRLKAFLNTPIGDAFDRHFVWENETDLKSWKMVMITQWKTKKEKSGSYVEDLRNTLQEYQHTLQPMQASRIHLFYESNQGILLSTLRSMAIASVAVLVVSTLLLQVEQLGLLVLFSVFMIDIGIIGAFPLVDLSLNIIVMINLIMSIGLSVDYTLHICHTFCRCRGCNKDEKINKTLMLMGPPLIHGLFSTLLSVSMFVFSDKQILRMFLKAISLVLLSGILNGIVLLPVILSIFGPTDAQIYSWLKQVDRDERRQYSSFDNLSDVVEEPSMWENFAELLRASARQLRGVRMLCAKNEKEGRKEEGSNVRKEESFSEQRGKQDTSGMHESILEGGEGNSDK